MIYSRKDKHKSGCFIQKGPSGYNRCQITQEGTMDKMSQYGSRSGSNQKKSDGKKNHIIRKN